MSTNKVKNNCPRREWVRTFDVGPARRNGNHMVYDVTSVLFPAGFPEAGTRLTTTKRFSQFQKLYIALMQIHQVFDEITPGNYYNLESLYGQFEIFLPSN